jgi:hypothetical protein
MYHFQLVLLLVAFELLADVLLAVLGLDGMDGVMSAWALPLYLWVVQLCQLCSLGFYVSVIIFVFTRIRKPHEYSVNVRGKCMLFVNMSVVIAVSLIVNTICAAVYLVKISNSSSRTSVATSLFAIKNDLIVASDIFWSLSFVLSLLVVAYIILVLKVGKSSTDPRVLQARSSVQSFFALIVLYSIPLALSIVVTCLLRSEIAVWRACAELCAGTIVPTGGVACLVVWWRQLRGNSPVVERKDIQLVHTDSLASMLESTQMSGTSFYSRDSRSEYKNENVDSE